MQIFACLLRIRFAPLIVQDGTARHDPETAQLTKGVDEPISDSILQKFRVGIGAQPAERQNGYRANAVVLPSENITCYQDPREQQQGRRARDPCWLFSPPRHSL